MDPSVHHIGDHIMSNNHTVCLINSQIKDIEENKKKIIEKQNRVIQCLKDQKKEIEIGDCKKHKILVLSSKRPLDLYYFIQTACFIICIVYGIFIINSTKDLSDTRKNDFKMKHFVCVFVVFLLIPWKYKITGISIYSLVLCIMINISPSIIIMTYMFHLFDLIAIVLV